MIVARSNPFSAGLCLYAAGSIVAVSVGALGQLGFARPASAGVALVVFAAIVFLVLLALRRNGMATFGPANAVTLMRAVLASLIAGLTCESLYGTSANTSFIALVLVMAGVAVATDAVDGWIARRSGMVSSFGARFDMETDALLILILSVLAWSLGQAGFWIIAAGLMRYAFQLAGWRWPVLAAPLPPSRRRKLICAVQTTGLMIMLVVSTPLSHAIGAITLGLLASSFAMDILWLTRHQPLSVPSS